MDIKFVVILHSCFLYVTSNKLIKKACDACDMHCDVEDETIRHEDLVQKQYQNLPYPVFTQDHLKEEQKSYDEKPNRLPKYINNDNDFEVLNHFLFSGKENFT